jgi:hypothetical protein
VIEKFQRKVLQEGIQYEVLKAFSRINPLKFVFLASKAQIFYSIFDIRYQWKLNEKETIDENVKRRKFI